MQETVARLEAHTKLFEEQSQKLQEDLAASQNESNKMKEVMGNMRREHMNDVEKTYEDYSETSTP